MTAPKNAAINGSRTSPLQGAISVRYATPIPKTIKRRQRSARRLEPFVYSPSRHHSCCRSFQFGGEQQSSQVEPLPSTYCQSSQGTCEDDGEASEAISTPEGDTMPQDEFAPRPTDNASSPLRRF